VEGDGEKGKGKERGEGSDARGRDAAAVVSAFFVTVRAGTAYRKI